MSVKTVNTVKVYQFKITLKGSKPVIWRRILIPKNMTFWDLHGAIQDSMGWRDSHLHQFLIKGDCVGIADVEAPDTISGKIVKISVYFERIGDEATYEYDFGDGWEHEVVLEKITEEAEGIIEYPRCIGGKFACPPEDCGGVFGYRELLSKLANHKHKEHKEMKTWIDKLYPGFKANAFNPKSVVFIHFKTKGVLNAHEVSPNLSEAALGARGPVQTKC